MNPPPRRVPPAVWVGSGVLVGMTLAGLYAAPKVVAVSPPHESQQVPARAPIRIEFDQPMDLESTESHLLIEPRLGGSYRWQGSTLSFEPDSAWPEGTVVSAQISAGARSRRGLPLLRATRWSFTIGGPRVIYLWPAGAPANLQAHGVEDGGITPLTSTEAGLTEYRLSAQGTALVYLTEGEGAEIRRLDLATLADEFLFRCPDQTACASPALSPDGLQLAYVEAPLVEGPGGRPVAGPSQVWVLRIGDANPPLPMGPADHVTSTPDWTPHGWLSYYDHTTRAFALVDARAGPEPEPFRVFPSEVGERGTWSPDGAYIVFPEIDFFTQDLETGEGGELFFSHLYRWEFESALVDDLSQDPSGRVEDASPSYSPDGEWIAFGRKFLDAGRWTLGRQVWLMQADGSDPHQLTNEPAYHHSSLDWNASSDGLAFMRFNQSELSQPPEIWLYDLGLGEARPLAVGGYLPKWIP